MSKYRKITVKNYNFNWVYSSKGAYIRAADDNNPHRGPYKADCGRHRNKHDWEVKPSDVARWITENIFNEKYIEPTPIIDNSANEIIESPLVVVDCYILIKRSWYTIEQYYKLYNDEVLLVSDDPALVIKLRNEYEENNTNKDWEWDYEGSKIEYIRQVVKKIV